MIFGVLRDKKEGEYRVICTPLEVASIVDAGHSVLCEAGCGAMAGFPDEEYSAAGAVILSDSSEIFKRCDMVAKVKEIQPSEYPLLREGQIVYACLHPAANPEEVKALLSSRCIACTAEDSHRYGSPNCEAAGKMGAFFGLESLLTINGGKGKFVSGLAGSPGIKALILGAGLVGKSALSVLFSLGASITVMDINYGALKALSEEYRGRINTTLSTKESIRRILPETDLVINSVRWQKERKDFLIDKEMLETMEHGSVIVDVSNDSPGAIETSHPTTHASPRYTVSGVVHYCVDNIPSAIAYSASSALAAETLPTLLSILNLGVKEACKRDGFLRRSLTAYKGYLTHEETSAISGLSWIRPEDILGIKDGELDTAPRATRTKSENYTKL